MKKIKYIGLIGLLLLGLGAQQAQAQQYKKGWQAGAALPVGLTGLKDWTNQAVGLSLDGAYVMPLPGDRAFFRAGLGLNYFPGKAKKIEAFQGYMEDGQLVWDDELIESWKDDTRTISLTGIQINADLIVPIGSTKLSLVTGISLNTWQKKVSGQYPHDWREIAGSTGGWNWVDWVWEGDHWGGGFWEWLDPDPWYPIDDLGRDNNFSGTVKNIFGKLGFRLGVEYALNDKFTITAMLQLTELGTDAEFLDKKFRFDYDYDRDEDGNIIPGSVIHAVPGSENKISGKHNVNPAWVQIGVRYKF